MVLQAFGDNMACSSLCERRTWLGISALVRLSLFTAGACSPARTDMPLLKLFRVRMRCCRGGLIGDGVYMRRGAEYLCNSNELGHGTSSVFHRFNLQDAV